MIFSVSNEGDEWSLDFGPDTFTLSAEEVVQELTKSSHEFPLAAWSLLMSQRQDFLNNDPGRAPITPKQQGIL